MQSNIHQTIDHQVIVGLSNRNWAQRQFHSFVLYLSILISLLIAVSQPAFCAPATKSAITDVVELFTSQGCSSCPPADRFLAELIEENPQLVALSFHVDYWNQLIHGSDGSWVDPFSDAAFTERQRQYYLNQLKGRPGVYTPQLVINGEFAAVGSDRKAVLAKLGQRQAAISVEAQFNENGNLAIDVHNPAELESQLWLVIFDKAATTQIAAGENRHLTIENHRIVKSVQALDKIKAVTTTVSVPVELRDGQGCAVLVQSAVLQPIDGAALCPD